MLAASRFGCASARRQFTDVNIHGSWFRDNEHVFNALSVSVAHANHFYLRTIHFKLEPGIFYRCGINVRCIMRADERHEINRLTVEGMILHGPLDEA